MVIKSKWYINLDRFSNYVFGDDKNLYKKASIDTAGRHRAIRPIKIIERETKGYWLHANGKTEWWSLAKLEQHIEKVKEQEILFQTKDLPF